MIYCPLSLTHRSIRCRGEGQASECMGEACAWWTGGRCAVVDIAASLNEMVVQSKQPYPYKTDSPGQQPEAV